MKEQIRDPRYLRIFQAFNAFAGDPQKSPAARDFLTFSATPDTMLQTLSFVRNLAQQEKLDIQDHKTTYLRGLTKSLDSKGWNQSHAEALINITDWLISMRDKSHHSTNYLFLLRGLVTKIPKKVSIPVEKRQEWAKAVITKRSYIPKVSIGIPTEWYGRNYVKPYTQNLSADDRN